MRQHQLIIACGIPGAGKSTLAHHLADRWGAISFASETFAAELGAAARTPSGDLSPQAIAHAYTGMANAAAAALATRPLVVVVGSFRSQAQRVRFREVAAKAGGRATTLRIACPIDAAAERVRLRLASGERGPTERSIKRIDDELAGADDIDIVLTNDVSIGYFHRRLDALMEALTREPDGTPPDARVLAERFEQLADEEAAVAKDRMGTGAAGVERELQRSHVRMKELQHCLLLGIPASIRGNIETAIQEIAARRLRAVERL